jgi:hypothetical protein
VRDSQVAETMTRAIARARARARVARHRDGHGLPRRTHGRRRLAVGGGSDRALRAVRAEQVSASADKRSLTFGARHRQPLLLRVADTLPTFSSGLPTGLPKRSPTRRWCYGGSPTLADPLRPDPTAGCGCARCCACTGCRRRLAAAPVFAHRARGSLRLRGLGPKSRRRRSAPGGWRRSRPPVRAGSTRPPGSTGRNLRWWGVGAWRTQPKPARSEEFPLRPSRSCSPGKPRASP